VELVGGGLTTRSCGEEGIIPTGLFSSLILQLKIRLKTIFLGDQIKKDDYAKPFWANSCFELGPNNDFRPLRLNGEKNNLPSIFFAIPSSIRKIE
jgi:hypothetical protein